MPPDILLPRRGSNLLGEWIQSLRTGWLTGVMHGLTYLGGAFVLTAATLALVSIFLFVCRRRADALVLGVCMLGAFGLSQLLKTSFHRPRPPLPWLVGTSGYSFPSGHALLTMSLFGFLAYLAMRHGRGLFRASRGSSRCCHCRCWWASAGFTWGCIIPPTSWAAPSLHSSPGDGPILPQG